MPSVSLSLKYWLLLLQLFCVFAVSARSFRQFQVIHYGDEALPQTSIGDITGDDDGYIWLCTQMGLLRFDGQHFRTYNPTNTPALKATRSRFFFTDKADRKFYWDISYSFYEMKKGSFVPVKPSTFSHAIKGHVMNGREMPSRDLPEADKMPRYVANKLMDPARMVYYVLGDDTTTIAPRAQPTGYGFLQGKAIFVFGNHSFKIKYPGSDIDSRLTITGDILQNPLWKDTSFGLSGCFQSGKMYLQLGNVLYHTQLIGDRLSTSEFITDLDIKLVSCIYEDEQNGYIAIGTPSDGLYMLYPKSFSTRMMKSGSASNSFYNVGHLRDNIYLSSNGYEFDLFSTYEKHLFNTKGLGFYRHGDYLVTGIDAGAKGINVKTGELKTFIPDMRRYGWFHQGYDDPWGRSWVAGSNGFGRFDTTNNTVNWIQLFANTSVRETDNIDGFHFLNKDTVMIGCRNGLILLDINTRKTTRVPNMRLKNIRNFVDAGDGGVWLLTYGSGYYYYRNGRFKAMPMDRNHYLESVHTMLLDKNGFYWLPTNKGLFRASRAAMLQHLADTTKEVRYEYFNKQCGFESNEFNGGCNPCGLIASDSLFLLPNMIGLVYFNPLSVRTPPLNSPIYVDRILIDGREVAARSTYKLPASFSSFYCEVSSPFFGSQENVVLEYMIEGLNNSWQPLINNRYVQFNRLPHGSYELKIRKLTGFSSNDYAFRTIQLTVATPVYLQTWFLVIVVMFILLLLWLMILIRVRLLTRQKRKLEDQVEDRTQQLAKSLSQLKETVVTLEQSQAELRKNNRFKEQLTSIVLHDIQTPLRFLKRVVKNIRLTYGTFSPEALGEELDELYLATAEVTDYSQDFLIWIRSQKEGFSMTPKLVDIAQLLSDVKQLYQKIAQNAGADIDVNCSPDLQLETDPALLGIIIRNLVDNAVKYAPKGTIRLSGEIRDKLVIITVTDNGKGMNNARINEIMNSESQQSTVTSGKLGYQLVKDMLRRLNGQLQIESETDKGTKVILIFGADKQLAVHLNKPEDLDYNT